jgi:ribosome maturation factor RimP
LAKATAKQKQAMNHSHQFSDDVIQAIENNVLTLADSLLPHELVALAVEWVKEANQWILRLAIERRPDVTLTTTVSLDECAMVSRLLDEALNTASSVFVPIPEECAFSLEVSSPGLFRTLTTDRELAFYTGTRVTLTPNNISANQLHTITGQLLSFTSDSLTIQAEHSKDATELVTTLRSQVTVRLFATLQPLVPEISTPFNPLKETLPHA